MERSDPFGLIVNATAVKAVDLALPKSVLCERDRQS